MLDDLVDVDTVFNSNIGFGMCCLDYGAVRDPLGMEPRIFS